MLESYAIHAAIRGVHVLGMALALGGAVLVRLSFRGDTGTTRDAVGPSPLFVAQ